MKLSGKKKDLYRRVDEILHYLWDPIRVSDTPLARDEYHSYLPKVFSLVISDKKHHEISEYLVKIESGSMGISPNIDKATEIAKLLIETREAMLE
ncbi:MULTISPECIES: hypothetical protein [Pseudoalteromonas]|uniref:Uncharacterized protein n=1 Tax=Pseudoalteromonas luteoviolacea (strain 2ta16) TaxID=1353533 RepID=V4HU93_PSEL2|nr:MULTISPECIES: hypothetical protein [Pseudoalteromonas]ESP91489.1 hypothetical protein PL2TA16_00288 [Pseudoalteromonas luteoviolacea 2ta16]KZN40140.1 hypothetical protein N483_18295 [Pseudoalteromonas luteoviolacea NCIMB 1944]MCG7551172.1 hypothetical protein [Pseudoalteromonas sp. Of7M-16]